MNAPVKEDHVVTKVVGRINAPAAKVWEYLSWRGVAKLRNVAVIDRITMADDGDGPGAVRTLHLKDGSTVSEYVDAIDDAARWYVYKPTELGSLPVKDYTGRVEVVEEGSTACIVIIQSRCIPVGVTADEWRAAYTELETQVIDFVRRKVEA